MATLFTQASAVQSELVDFLMGTQITLDAVLERKGMRGNGLAARTGVRDTHLSLFRPGKVKAGGGFRRSPSSASFLSVSLGGAARVGP